VRGCLDLVQLEVKVGENRAASAYLPWPAAEQLNHRRAIDSLHDQIGAVITDCVDARNRKSLLGEVGHRLGFGDQ
jgi:hypothetical protein